MDEKRPRTASFFVEVTGLFLFSGAVDQGTREQGNEGTRKQVKDELAVEVRCGCDETAAIVGEMGAIWRK
jgi:hypothetical protein